MFIRNCPTCGDEIVHKSKKSLNQSKRKNSNCKICGNKEGGMKRIGMKCTDETKKKLSKINKGRKLSEETKIKMRDAKKGKELSEESRIKMRDAKKGKKLSEEHKTNIGNSIRGLKRSDETKLKCSLTKLGDKNPSKRPEVKEKIRNTINKLYSENPDYKERISQSLINYFNNNINYVNPEEKNKYSDYKRLVKNLTRRNKKELLIKWDGHDYYDYTYIKDNFKLNYNDPNYPTIDHKISILKGYKSGIDYKIIGNIDNLCITKRILNEIKGPNNEIDFILKFR